MRFELKLASSLSGLVCSNASHIVRLLTRPGSAGILAGELTFRPSRQGCRRSQGGEECEMTTFALFLRFFFVPGEETRYSEMESCAGSGITTGETERRIR